MGRIGTALAAVAALLVAGCATGAPASPEGAAREVAHAMGTTAVPAQPQRVVVLDSGELDSVLALGVTPVGAVTADGAAGLPGYLADRTGGITTVGTIGAPDLEAVAALDPDLILSNRVRHEELYAQLSRIAPTVFAERVGVAWKDNLRLAGRALGREADAEAVLAAYGRKAAETGRRFGDPASVEVSMVRFVGGTVRLYGEGSFIGTVLADAGLARPEVQRVDSTFVEISPEQVAEADGDLLFYAAYQSGGAADLAAVTAGPLWGTLPAVAQGRAAEVSDDLWYLGIGPLAADRVLDELGARA
jgi:iron complex transport system substrate-binding protein